LQAIDELTDPKAVNNAFCCWLCMKYDAVAASSIADMSPLLVCADRPCTALAAAAAAAAGAAFTGLGPL
jgi:hypothetical protein